MASRSLQDTHLARGASLRAFLLVALVLGLPAAAAHWALGRYNLHLALNSWHTTWGDLVFPWITELANGFVPVVLAAAMLWFSWRSFLMMALSTCLAAIVVQLLKHLVFDDFHRPTMHLDQMPGLHLVAGVDFHSHFSFPSGHSAAAFSMCLALALIIGRFATAMVLALTASLLAFSRVYLSQHFTEDIVAGALVGSVASAAIYYLLYQSPLSQRAALDRAPFGTRG